MDVGRLALVVFCLLSGLVSGCSDKGPVFEIIGHRGASAHAPENTLSAFKLALQQGASHIELDVQLTRDGQVAIFHDGRLRPKTSGRGAIRDHDLETLRQLDLVPWFRKTHLGEAERALLPAETRIASLAELFTAVGRRAAYHIELKSRDEALAARVVSEIRRFSLDHRARVSSFHLEQLLRARSEAPALPLCWLLPAGETLRDRAREDRSLDDLDLQSLRRVAIDRAQKERIDTVAFPAAEVERPLVEYAHSRGVDLRVWQVPDLATLKHAVAVGASGATVDWPGRALSWFRDHPSTR